MSKFSPISAWWASVQRGKWTRAAILALFLVAGLAMWFRFMAMPDSVAGPGDLDGSWGHAYGYFLKNDLQAGQDYIFTYGPLGYFYTTNYDPDLFWYKYAWELVVRLVFVAAILWFTGHLPGLPAKLVFCFLAFVFVQMTEFFFPLLLLGVIAVVEERIPVAYLVAVSLFLAVFGLVKFTYFIYCLSVVCLIAVGLVGNKRHWAALCPPAVFANAFCLIWLALGQSLANLPRYLYGSLQITSGYAEGMSSGGSLTELYLAGSIFLAFWAALLPFSAQELPAARRLGSLRQLSLLGLLAVTGFLEWKHGFIRHGGISIVFYCFFALAPFLLPSAFPNYDWRTVPRARLTTACFCLSLAGIAICNGGTDWIELADSLPGSVSDNLEKVISPLVLKGQLDKQLAEKHAEAALPRTCARVGDASVDVISFEQRLVVFNKMNWRPRPVFQSYSAYTPFLQAANTEFFRSARAPEYTIFQLQTTDDRFPALDEGQALLEILKRYRPVLVEKDCLLLERMQTAGYAEVPAGEVVLAKKIQFGEVVDLSGLPGPYQTLALTFRPSLWGRLRNLIYRPPQVRILVSTDLEEKPASYRLIPSMAGGGFVINPLLTETDDVMDLYDYKHPVGKKATSFSIACAVPGSYDDEIAVTIKSYPRLVGCELDPAFQNQLHYPMIKTPFARAQAAEPLNVILCDGREVLRAHAPSALEFDVPARLKPSRATGKFGILPGAYGNPQNHTDGVQFAVEYVAPAKPPVVLFERFLNPQDKERDRAMQEFTVMLPPGEKGTVVLRASNPPGKTQHLDWSYWTDVDIEGADRPLAGYRRGGGRDSEDEELLRQVRLAVTAVIPAGATVAVVSKGDDDLVSLPGYKGWHFPQDKAGSYLGYNPDPLEAVGYLEAVRAKGAGYLVFPETAFWWLEEYPQFRRHLEDRYPRVHASRYCIIYRLGEAKGG
jgi:hypothetical protein